MHGPAGAEFFDQFVDADLGRGDTREGSLGIGIRVEWECVEDFVGRGGASVGFVEELDCSLAGFVSAGPDGGVVHFRRGRGSRRCECRP